MQEIPRQVASALHQDCIGAHMRAARLTENGVQLTDGRELNAKTIVLATDARQTRHCLNEPESRPYFTERCFYFTADQPPFSHKMLVLNGEGGGKGPVINFTVPGRVSPACAPSGKTVMAAVVIGKVSAEEDELTRQVTRQFNSKIKSVTARPGCDFLPDAECAEGQ